MVIGDGVNNVHRNNNLNGGGSSTMHRNSNVHRNNNLNGGSYGGGGSGGGYGGGGNSINLDLSKLISFCNSTVNNSTEYNLNLNLGSNYNETSIIKNVNTCKINLLDEIKKIKNSLLLNEKGVSNKYSFIHKWKKQN